MTRKKSEDEKKTSHNLFGYFVSYLCDHINPFFELPITREEMIEAILGVPQKTSLGTLSKENPVFASTPVVKALAAHAPYPDVKQLTDPEAKHAVIEQLSDLNHYHDTTIRKLLTETYGNAKGIKTFRDDFANIPKLEQAVVTQATRDDNMSIPNWLDAAPLTPECDFCRKMYARYDAMYHQQTSVVAKGASGPAHRVSDLELSVEDIPGSFVASVKRRLDEVGWPEPNYELASSLAIYAHLLVMVLMGPEAVNAGSGEGATASFGPAPRSYQKALAGFSLAQKTVGDGGLITADAALAFGPGLQDAGDEHFQIGRRPAVGDEPNPLLVYSTFHADGQYADYVSRRHAEIQPVREGGQLVGWRLVALSRANSTAVNREGEVMVLGWPDSQNDSLLLQDGDEIWLVPATTSEGGLQPYYEGGAVLVFHFVYDYQASE